MSPFERRSWFPSATKKPPPEHGIKIKKAGTTWWGERWISALELVLRGDSGRLARGRTYARAGRTHDVVVKAGTLTAQVTGSRDTPYRVTLELVPFSDAVWRRAVVSMALKAQFTADLLAGEMPKEIDDVFLEAGSSLFPTRKADLRTSCSCPDSGNPCKHVAATHYVLGEALDRDPFLLFELRGKPKAWVLEALRAARDVRDEHAGKQPVPSVAFANLKPQDYDAAPQALPALKFSFDAPTTHASVLRQLGAPTAWRAPQSPSEVLSPLVRKAAEAARRIALSESEVDVTERSDENPAPAPKPRPKKRRKR